MMTRDIEKQILRELAELRAQFGTVWCRHAESSGGGTANLTKFAVVTTVAGESTHDALTGISGGTTGKAVLLKDEGNNLVPTVILDSGDPEYSSGDVTDAEIEFKSLLRVPCPVGSIVELSSNEAIRAGSVFSTTPVWGRIIDLQDEPGWVGGNAQSMGHDAGEGREWQDDTDECPEEEEEP